MKAKICGIRTLEAAYTSVDNGATAVGFVFAESKRKVSIETAKTIISALPKHIVKVGVFVNPTIQEIHTIVNETGINIIQLHGNETPEFCNNIPYPIIKALSIEKEKDLYKMHDYSCEYILLDGPKGKYFGGNGIAFDWKYLSGFDFREKKLILAGGLNPENVTAAIIETMPYMVDVSSGVETNGQKDLQKIRTFLERVKSEKNNYQHH